MKWLHYDIQYNSFQIDLIYSKIKFLDKMAYDFTIKTIEKIGWQFYLVNPNNHMYEKVEDLPNPSYTNQVIHLK